MVNLIESNFSQEAILPIPNHLREHGNQVSLDSLSQDPAIDFFLKMAHIPSYSVEESTEHAEVMKKNMQAVRQLIATTFEKLSDQVKTTVDHLGNLIIKIPGSGNMKKKQPIMFLSHFDIYWDWQTDPSKTITTRLVEDSENKKLYLASDGTTVLGADSKADIATIYAACKNIMDSGIPHRGFEILLSPDEENTCESVNKIDMSQFESEAAINVDSDYDFTITDNIASYVELEINISGLEGGYRFTKDTEKLTSAFEIVGKLIELLPPKISHFHPKSIYGNPETEKLADTSLELRNISSTNEGGKVADNAKLTYSLKSHTLDHQKQVLADFQSAIEQIQSLFGANNPKLEINLSVNSDLGENYYPMMNSANGDVADNRPLIQKAVEAAKKIGHNEVKVEPMHGFAQANFTARGDNKFGQKIPHIALGSLHPNLHYHNETQDIGSFFDTTKWLEEIIKSFSE